ncbi:MAG: CRISPR system precrRNA processing endoribonuclease RAMP protein Cas6 [Planctomycetes bacterium]|nr:CRISPR system precrRNA processing endoribonuclease RAMP protein Cas6 [Planctomycetota bacterium]
MFGRDGARLDDDLDTLSPRRVRAMKDLERLRLLLLEVTAAARDPIDLPAFAGSTLRGALGRALKDVLCVASGAECGACRLADACAYPYLFETAPPSGARRLARLPFAPHPYALRAPPGPLALREGEEFSFGLALIGRATEFLPVVAQAVLRAGERGLGSTRGRFRVAGVAARRARGVEPVALVAGDPPRLLQAAAAACSDPSRFESDLRAGQASVRFESAVRLLQDGKPAREIPFHLLVRALLRRASSLLEFHEDIDLQLDFRGVIAAAEQVATLESRLAPEDRVRYSARQERIMNLRGLRGSVTYAGDLAPYQRLLALGEAVGVGKGTTFGLGRMRVEAAALAHEEAWTSEH